MDNKELSEIKKIISQVEIIIQRVDSGILFENVEDVLADAAAVINMKLYGSKNIEAYDGLESDCGKNPIKAVLQMMKIWRLSVERRSGSALDRDFWYLYERFRYVKREDIIDETINLFESYPDDYKEIFITLPERYLFLSDKIDYKEKDYSLIVQYVNMLKDNIEQFKWLFDRFADYRSKQIFLRIVRYWVTFNLNDLGDLHENVFGEYYDLDLIKHNENEVLVDCGAYIGDSIIGYVNTYGTDYKRIYGYEISPVNMNSLKQNVEGLHDIVLRQKGVGNSQGKMFVKQDGAGSRVSDQGEVEILVTTLDDDIDEPVTIIKMDIEGAEIDAIEGARKHILQDRPRLLICTYHKPDDIFKIPRLIDSIRGDYDFYLRFNGRGIWPCDHVLFAL